MTDPVLSGERGVLETVRQALEAGVTAVQLRDKTASSRDLLLQARALSAICRRHGAPFLVNDRVDIARAAGADGVHLGQDDLPLAEARDILGPQAIIGVSVRTAEEAEAACKGGADYIAANMIFSTATKTDLPGPLGLDAIATLRAACNLPLVAIGGINADNAGLVLDAGADGIAVVSAIMAAADVPAAVRDVGNYDKLHIES